MSIVSLIKEDYNEKARSLLKCAKDGIATRRKQKSKRFVGITNFLVNSQSLHMEEEMMLFVQAAESFRICGKWLDAADAYSQAAWIVACELKDEEAGAILYTEAGLCAMTLGIEEGEKNLSKLKYLYSYFHQCSIIY